MRPVRRKPRAAAGRGARAASLRLAAIRAVSGTLWHRACGGPEVAGRGAAPGANRCWTPAEIAGLHGSAPAVGKQPLTGRAEPAIARPPFAVYVSGERACVRGQF